MRPISYRTYEVDQQTFPHTLFLAILSVKLNDAEECKNGSYSNVQSPGSIGLAH